MSPLAGGLLEPAELAAGDPLELGDVLAEQLQQTPAQRRVELGLRRRSLARVVDEPLDHPAKRFREPVEVAVERPQAGQAHSAVHEPESPVLLAAAGLPFALELLGPEVVIDAAEP